MATERSNSGAGPSEHGHQQQGGARSPSVRPASVLLRRAGARFNVGGTLQSSVASGYRRRSTAATSGAGGLWAGSGGVQRRASGRPREVNDAESINYDNLDDMFEEDEPAPLVMRASTETQAAAKLSALSAQRADADGRLQAPPTMRQMVGFYLDTSATGRRWDQMDAVLNVAIAALHVFNTTHVSKNQLSVPYWSLCVEALVSLVLLLQFLPRYLLAPDPMEYVRGLFSVITLITALTPILVVVSIWIDPSVYDSFMSAGTLVFLYPVIFWRLQPALLRCLVPIKNVYRMSPMTRNVLRALTTVFTTVLAITVLTHIMVYYQNKDKDGEIQGFDEAFFFIAVSSITGLSSDIEPDTWFTRSVVLFVMFIGIFWLPPRVSEMLSLWQDRSPWPGSFEAETNQSHVLVIGDLEYTTLFEFLREFFCEDHGVRTVNTVVVVMSEKSPGKEVSELLGDPAYVNRVKFVLGSPTSFKQLGDVEAEEALAIFLLSSKAAGDNAAKEDAAKVMIALAVRKYLKGHGNPKRAVPIYAQVLLPETTLHLEYLADHVICVEELRLGLLARSVMVPGFASLLQLLTASIPNNTTEPLIKVAGRYKQEWLAEYAQSMSHEIYATRISSIFNGVKFQKAAQVIFQRTGATLFAIRVPDRREGADADDGRIMLNPAGYEFQGDELGFVLASNSLVSTQIAYLAEETVVAISGDGDADDGGHASETARLIPGITVSNAGKDDRPVRVGSPLQQTLAATEAQLKAKMPFGMNVMDTLVVSDSPHSLRDDSSSTKSGVSHHSGDLIDLNEDDLHIDHENRLSPELANIEVDGDDEVHGKGKARDGEAPESGETKHMHRAPLLFDPKQKASEVDLAAKRAIAAEGGEGAAVKTPEAGHRIGAFAAKADRKPKAVEPTADGLPGDLAGHIVVCDTSSEFPSNIIYLVSCIRAAAPSEVTAIAESTESLDAVASVAMANPFTSLYEQISRSYNAKEAEASTAEVKSSFLNQQPIVILSPAEPTATESDDLARFGNLYIVRGSPLSRTDLARVRIHTASSGIVLANREESLNAAADVSTKLSLAGSDTTSTATADAPALLSVLNIEALTYNSPDFFLSVEFIHRENMQFVGDTETVRINEVYAQAFLRPSFMSGRVYAPVMLDTLICQAFYNEHVLEIMQRLIFSHGDVVHALGMAKLNEAGIEGAPGSATEGELGAGHVFLVEVPPRFHGRSYSSLFSHCCFKHGAVPIGLYRAAMHHRQPLWYVMPNPGVACVLREDDRVYLIASTRPDLQ
ncbi:hypothetical protein GGH94_005392 [Coemansia aciculifera]|uniref:Calcium-activated potassium channel BK alpha subunit domain-containing protein n=1 Tax=Coemansia aciculifera TaxID=417176 RepID=A0A9W8ILK9_9FUNG|nr:hypothetical protein GGH94_005392 [Coemansia aciculifera]